jgi:hypothetical protein
MIIALISLAAIALWGAVATIVVVARDGYRQVPTAFILR